MPALEGGAPIPVTTGGSGPTEGRRAAVPVYVVSGASPVVGQKARRVVVVTDGPVEGGAAHPVYDAGANAVYSADEALPVFVVSGSLGSGVNPLAYALMRDLFTDTQNPTVDGNANPGAGKRDITGALLQNLAGRLRGGGQTSSPTWGNSKDVYTDNVGAGFARIGGRTFAALITIEDFNNRLAAGWDTATNTTDPRTVGHGWINEAGTNAGGLSAIAPGKQVALGNGIRNMRSQDYLAVVTLYPLGAVVMLSVWGADDSGNGMDGNVPIAAYPNASVLWVDGAATTTPLYPYVSYYDRVVSYPNGHAIDDVRVRDVASWAAQDSIAVFADRFTRADSTVSIGGVGWTALTGTWGISSNAAYIQAEAAPNAVVRQATGPSANGDGFYQFAVVIPAGGNGNWLCCVRMVDATHFIYVTNAGNSNTLFLRSNNGGAVANINSTGAGINFVLGSTVIITIRVMGAQYQVFVDGVQKLDWSTDSNAFFTTESRWGLAGVTGFIPNQAKWDYAWCYAHSVALPAEVIAGAVPYVATPGATLTSDDFNAVNGTTLTSRGWTEHAGTWTVQINRASVVLGGVLGLATKDAGQNDAEITLNVITPGAFTTDWHAGIALRVTDISNYMYVVCLRSSSQVGSDEIEFHEVIAGSDVVTHKSNVGSKFQTSTSYALKVWAKGDKVYVLLDGKPTCSLIPSATYAGTRFGIERSSFDTGCVFDDFVVKAI